MQKSLILLISVCFVAACGTNPQRTQNLVDRTDDSQETNQTTTQKKKSSTEPEATQKDTDDSQQTDSSVNSAEINLHATLWVQSSAEYEAAAIQTYHSAGAMLDEAIKDTTWTAAVEQTGNFSMKPPAIILDVDETVLDNSPYQARLLEDDAHFDSGSWNAWAREGNADAVPGAVDFLTAASARGVKIFYVTNRDAEVEPGTRANLRKLGFPMKEQQGEDIVLTKNEQEGWGSDKTSRRNVITAGYRVIMLFGDNLGDFIGDAKGNADSRASKFAPYTDRWGKSWFMLPNPMYGYWEGALYDYDYGMTPESKLLEKRKHLIKKR